MASNKPILFISHITEEKEIALKFKELIDSSFIGMFEIFVSSDPESIRMGQMWLNNITDALHNCSAAIIVCSPASVKRSWINFEAGAAWVRGIDVIPLCHSGLTPPTLPMPFSELQGAAAGDPSSIRLILSSLAKTIGSKTPSSDVSEFTEFVHKFESDYLFLEKIKTTILNWKVYNNAIFEQLLSKKMFEMNIPASKNDDFLSNAQFLEKRGLIKLDFLVCCEITSEGMKSVYGITSTEKLNSIINGEGF